MLTGESRIMWRAPTAGGATVDFVNSEAEPEPGLGDVTWPESLPHEREHDQTEIPAQTDDVPCVPLICPDEEDVSAVSDPRPERTSKRRRISPASLRLEHPPKSAVSIPAMVIPHLVSHGPMASTSAILSNN
ncbi:hypothetical protein BJV78DRAFT_585336 [Lactifluus subvellereus]|nr:hypothetical protein BJV78DRAFT_585336 [Lactifluus subvellereus]